MVRHAVAVPQHKGDLDDARDADGHEGVAKDPVGHGADGQFLRVGRHGPARQEDDEAGDEVALGGAVAGAAQPHAGQAAAPPDDAHGGVLPVVAHPGVAPAVLGEGVDAAPGGDDEAVEELGRAAGPAQPQLADQQQDRQQHAVGDEGAAHDEVGQALAEVVALAEAEQRDGAEEHVGPRQDGEGLAVEAVQQAHGRAHARVPAPVEVQAQVQAQDQLGAQEHEDGGAEAAVHVAGREGAPAVQVAEGDADEGD